MGIFHVFKNKPNVNKLRNAPHIQINRRGNSFDLQRTYIWLSYQYQQYRLFLKLCVITHAFAKQYSLDVQLLERVMMHHTFFFRLTVFLIHKIK